MTENSIYLTDLITNLSKPMPYQWRVQSFNKGNTKCTCVAYIDARQAMDTLDKYCSYGWTKKYYDIKGSIFLLMGDRPEAIANYRKSLQLNPENADTQRMLEKLNGGVQ